MGLESVLIKYLVDKQFISIFFILTIKGIIGSVIFGIIKIFSYFQSKNDIMELIYGILVQNKIIQKMKYGKIIIMVFIMI